MRYVILLFTIFVILFSYSTTTRAQPDQTSDEPQDKKILFWKVPSSSQKAFIPDISLIGSFAGGYFRDDPTGDHGENPSRTGFNFQGIEMAIQSVVDPYVRADIFIHFGEDEVEVEQAELTTLSLPWNLQIKAGKLLGHVGRENGQHLEQISFVDGSRLNRYFFGDEGFKELGVELSVLLPVSWYSQIAVQFLQGENEDNFDGSSKGDFAYVGHWTNTFDLSSTVTLQTGLSSAFGFNDTGSGHLTQIYGGDLYLRWRPSANHGLKWQTEYFLRKREEAAGPTHEGGLDSQLIWQWARRWESGVRFDWIGLPAETYKQKAYAADLTFLATEFFKIRTQYNFIQNSGKRNGHEAFLQAQFNIGPHGAHSF